MAPLEHWRLSERFDFRILPSTSTGPAMPAVYCGVACYLIYLSTFPHLSEGLNKSPAPACIRYLDLIRVRSQFTSAAARPLISISSYPRKLPAPAGIDSLRSTASDFVVGNRRGCVGPKFKRKRCHRCKGRIRVQVACECSWKEHSHARRHTAAKVGVEMISA
ncbi:hypothetical protein DFH29DRAFT_59364 [Suillus ampliporus]|nr:hypothetical protein DFH29DRAFT_59364 [Suillus ampliporus]